MNPVVQHRIDGHELNGVSELLASGEHVIVQFSKPPATKRTLTELNRLAKKYGVALQLRFLGYYGLRKFVFYSKSRRLDVEIHKRLRALGFEDTLLD